jgi:plastocyanin
MRRITLATLAALALLGAACGGGAETPAEAGNDAEETTAEDAAQSTSEEAVPAPAGPGTGFARAADCTLITKGETATIFALDNSFAPDCVVLVANQVLRVQNVGIRDHTLTISEQQDDQTPFLFDLEYEGETTVESDGPLSDSMGPGTYEFFCKFHSGMDGVMQVVEPVET